MHSVRLEPTKSILAGTLTIYIPSHLLGTPAVYRVRTYVFFVRVVISSVFFDVTAIELARMTCRDAITGGHS